MIQTRVVALGLALAGCTAPASAPASATADQPPPMAAPPPNPSALDRPKRPILVGGCLTRCKTPMESATAFLRHSAAGDRAALVSHLDTAELVAFGEKHGDAWANETGEPNAGRGASIDAFVSRWLSESQAVEGAAPELQLSRGATGESATVLWSAPGGQRFRITLGRRGLEWLVRAIERPAT